MALPRDLQQDILASLSSHVRLKLARLGDALSLELRDTERLLLADLLAEHDALTRRVHAFDRHIDEELTPYADQCRLLETLPGIDHTSACAILSEMGPDPSVFVNAHRFAAWAGLCPGNNESAGKRRSGRTRRGNQTLRAVLVECAHGAARTNNCQFQAYHKALTGRRGYKRAIVATAHKLLRCVFAALRDGTPYRDPGTDYEALLRQAQRGPLAAQAARVRHPRPQRRRDRLGALAIPSKPQDHPRALISPSNECVGPAAQLGVEATWGSLASRASSPRHVSIAASFRDAFRRVGSGASSRFPRPQ